MRAQPAVQEWKERTYAHELALPGGSVDGARVERVLQHLDEPGRALAEMARVVRRGGRVVAAEPDWGTFVIDSDDPWVAGRVAAAAARRLRSPCAGRTLRRLFIEAGLEDVGVTARPPVITDGSAAAGLRCPGGRPEGGRRRRPGRRAGGRVP